MRIIVLVLGLGLIAGCGKKGKGEPADTDTNPDPDTDTDTDTDTDALFRPGDLLGHNFRLGLGSGDWIQPSSPPVGLKPVLVGVAAANNNSVDLFFAIPDGSSNDQNLCRQTDRLPTATLNAQTGKFSVGPVDWTHTSGITEYNFAFSGTFWADSTGADDVGYYTMFDFRETAPLVGQTATDVCNVLAGSTRPCEPCPDSQVYCQASEVENVPFQDLGLDPLIERSAADIAGDPDC